MFLTCGDFATWEHLEISEDKFWLLQLGEHSATSIKWVETRDAAKYPTM